MSIDGFLRFWELTIKTVKLVKRLQNQQPIKPPHPTESRSIQAQKRGRVEHDFGYDTSQWHVKVEYGLQGIGSGPPPWLAPVDLNGAEFDRLFGDAGADPQGTLETADVLACVLALFPKGSNPAACRGVGVLPVDIIEGFKTIAAALLKHKVTISDDSEIVKRLRLVVNDYKRIWKYIKEEDKSKTKSFPDTTLKDVDRAGESAFTLYCWAKDTVSNKLNRSEPMSKQAKIQVVPYIAALAYTTRIRVITCLVEVDMASQESEKERHLERASRIVDDFMAVVCSALEGLMADTSLVEVALDYELPMAMYMTLITSFRASVDGIKSPNTRLEEVAVWEDAGLASIREALHWNPSGVGHHQGQAQIVELDSANESLWWAAFTDTDLSAVFATNLRTSIDICEVARVLGVDSDEIAAKLALKPGQKSALLQLRSASALRADLCTNINQTCRAVHAGRPSPAPPPSFARVSTLRNVAAAASARLQVAAPRTLSGHTHWVMSVAVCADSDRVVSSSRDKTARVWSLSTGQPLRTFAGHIDEVNCVALSSDGTTAVSGSDDGSVRVWSVDSSDAPYTLHQNYSGRVWAVAVSPDGRSIASGSTDKSVHLWNVETGRCIASLSGHSNTVACVAFSPDGKTLVSGSWDKSIRVWDVRTRSLLHTLDGHSDAVRGVAVTPDGRRLVSGCAGGTVKVWNLSSGDEEMSFEGHTQAVSSVAVFPDGQRIVSGSFDKSVRVWNLHRPTPEPELELELTGHSDAVQCVAVSPDGRRVVSGSQDSTIKVWGLSEDGGEGAAR